MCVYVCIYVCIICVYIFSFFMLGFVRFFRLLTLISIPINNNNYILTQNKIC